MKKLISIMLFVVFTTAGLQNVMSQRISTGLKGGLTISNLYISTDDLEDENSRLGFHAGFFGQVMFNEFVGFQPEFLFNTKGVEAEYTGNINQNVNFRFNYLDIPLLFVYRPGEVFELYLGPYLGILLHSNIRYSGTIDGHDALDRDHFSSLDYGLAGGVGFNFRALRMGLRYNHGLQEVADTNAARFLLGPSKHAFAQVYVAFHFGRYY
jgi:hypothetical protein